MIIIATVGRCGSSLMMQYMEHIGYNVGKVKFIKAYSAGYENAETLSINNQLRILKLAGKPLNELSIYAKIKEISYDVIKDPQFLTIPELIEHWWGVRQDIKVLFLTRNAQSITESLKRVPEMNTPVYRCFPEMIVKHEKDFLKRLGRLGIVHAVLRFPDFSYQYKTISKALNYIGAKRGSEKEWLDVFKPSMIHFR